MNARQDRIGKVLLGASVAALVGGALLGQVFQRTQPHFDPNTGCEIGKPLGAVTTVLIDLTDPIPTGQWAEVLDRLRGLERYELRGNERVALWVLTGGGEGALRRVFCRWHPSTTVNQLTGNEALATATSDSLFGRPFARALADLPHGGSAPATPLLESIQAISEPASQAPGVPHRLIVVSNLEQNSAALSLMRSVPSFGTFHASQAGRKLDIDLRGVSVEVLFAPRGHSAAAVASDLPDFFRGYFNANGASSVRIERL